MTSQSETRALREALEKVIDQLEKIKTECEATADQFSGADMVRSSHYESGRSQGIQVGIEFIQSALATPASREGWQPIATVPLKTQVLLYWPGKVGGRSARPEQITVGEVHGLTTYAGATHWQPLPAAPDVEGGR